MSFMPVINVNEKEMNKEQIMTLLMDSYKRLENSSGPDYYEVTLRLSVWAGKMPESREGD